MSAPPLRVAVLGAAGRLGAFACGLFERTPDFDLVGRWGRSDDWRSVASSSGTTVVFEATRAGLGFEHARALLEHGLRPLIATSGVQQHEVEQLDQLARARGIGGLVVPNFSLGVWLMQRAAELAAPHFDQVEIVEAHHAHKADAPSGTAVDTARRIAEARQRVGRAPLDPPNLDAPSRGELRGGVLLHSLRLSGVYARQEVLFSCAGELFSLRHELEGPAAFGPGILLAARSAATRVGIAVGLDAVLDDRS